MRLFSIERASVTLIILVGAFNCSEAIAKGRGTHATGATAPPTYLVPPPPPYTPIITEGFASMPYSAAMPTAVQTNPAKTVQVTRVRESGSAQGQNNNEGNGNNNQSGNNQQN